MEGYVLSALNIGLVLLLAELLGIFFAIIEGRIIQTNKIMNKEYITWKNFWRIK